MSKNKYIELLNIDGDLTHEYYLKSIRKTEHQKFLEKYLKENSIGSKHKRIADIACGYGTLSFHLKDLYPDHRYFLLDLNKNAIENAKTILSDKFGERIEYFVNDMFETPFDDNYFDVVFCWETLGWIDQPEKLLNELIRIVDKGGKVFISSLFNFDHEVDIYSKVYDYTLKSGNQNYFMNYNTYSCKSVKDWVHDNVTNYEIIRMNIEIDLEKTGNGMGTYTVNTDSGQRLEISGGLLMNWGLLVLNK